MTQRSVSVLEQEFSTTFLDVAVLVSFIDHDGSIEIVGCKTAGTGEEILLNDVLVHEWASFVFITATKYLEGEAATYLNGRL